MWKNKAVLVTGSKGMIGKELVIQLKELGALVEGVDLSVGVDLRDFELCKVACLGIDYVFHLAGIKGSPKMTKERPVDFMGPMLQFDTNMILAAQEAKVKGFLYTSSIAVENTDSDKFPSWAKKTAETLIEAQRIQNPEGTEYCIVRPSNVYGRFDNFEAKHPMVVTSLIKKALTEPTLDILGDGEQTRDFINAKDVAKGMIQTMEKMPKFPVNLCSGKSETIKQVAELVSMETGTLLRYVPLSDGKVMGKDSRLMTQNLPIDIEVDLAQGIKEVVEHVKNKKLS